MFQVYISYVRRKKKTSSSVSMTLCVFFSFLFLLNSLKPKQKKKIIFYRFNLSTLYKWRSSTHCYGFSWYEWGRRIEIWLRWRRRLYICLTWGGGRRDKWSDILGWGWTRPQKFNLSIWPLWCVIAYMEFK